MSKGGMEGISLATFSQSINELVENSIEATRSCNTSSLSRDKSSNKYCLEESPSTNDGVNAIKCGVGVIKHGKASCCKKVQKSNNTRKKGMLTF